MQVNISSGGEQKAGWFKPSLLSQGQGWALSNVSKSIMLLFPFSSPRERSSARAGFLWLLHTSCNFLQLQCHSAVLCCESCSLRINLDLRNWERLHYNPSKWQLSCQDCPSLQLLPSLTWSCRLSANTARTTPLKVTISKVKFLHLGFIILSRVILNLTKALKHS